MEGYKFVPEILKYKEENEQKQRIIIALKKDGLKYTVFSPATTLLEPWRSCKDVTIYNNAKIICGFLNYVYKNDYVQRFEDIDSKHIVQYINELSKTRSRRNVQWTLNSLKTAFFYLVSYYGDDICDIKREEFDVYKDSNLRNRIRWDDLETEIMFPSVNQRQAHKKNKLTNLDNETVFRFLDIARTDYPNCAFGFYFLFFGGLRASEVCHLTRNDIPINVSDSGMFYIDINDKIISESKYSDLAQSKRNRKQGVLVVPEIFNPLYKQYKERNNTGAIVKNRDGEPLGIGGFRKNFNSVKEKLIKSYMNSDSEELKTLGFKLAHYDWSTHIGRGYFSNLIADNSKNPYLVSVARGDANFDSALPYLAEGEKTSREIADLLNTTYKKIREK